MLGCLLDFGTSQAKPDAPVVAAYPLHRGSRNDMMRLVEVMYEADDEIALGGCIACPRNLAGMSVACLHPKALDAVIRPQQPGRKRPKSLPLWFVVAHLPAGAAPAQGRYADERT